MKAATTPTKEDPVDEVTVQRLVFPCGFELPASASELQSLYVSSTTRGNRHGEGRAATLGSTEVLDRTRVRIPAGAILSTDTYFNRVHAGYWQRWTSVQAITARVTGEGRARIAIRRSTAGGAETTVRVIEGDLAQGLSHEVPLAASAAGGCLWLEIEAVDDAVVVDDARWTAPVTSSAPRTDVAVCTFDRPEDVFSLLSSLRRDEECRSVIDRVWVIDNGTKRFTELPGADSLVEEWGDRLQHVRQPNLGGSGGFARGLFEAAYHGDSPYVLLLDDDVVVEPEGIRRQVVFADLAKRPVAVGGQMLNRAEPTVLHSSGEWVDTSTMRWGVAPGAEESIRLEEERLDDVIDVAFNAWWSCLIPTDAVRKAGLSMPFFIKYDDVEFGYRMARAGFRTVSLPGAAVWHEPWSLKDDTTDWTLYFHVRNRLIFTALMSAGLPDKVQKKRLNTVLQDVFKRDIVRNVLRRAYASAGTAELAMRDFLRGPQVLEEPLQEAVARVRAARSIYPDAQTDVPTGGRGDVPTSVHRKKGPKVPLGLPRSVLREYGVPVPRVLPIPIQLLRGRRQTADAWRIWQMPTPLDEPRELPKVADHWWGLVDLPDAWVTTVDGSKVTRRRRTPALSRELTRRAFELSKSVREEFPRLAEEYAAAAEHLVTPESWASQFGIEVDQ